MKHAKIEPECNLCFKDLQDEDEADFLCCMNGENKINHAFHRECLGNWLEKNSTCPTCRTQFSKESLDNRLNSTYGEVKKTSIVDQL